ncbi:hypothetical protein HPG69_011996 [Diceros bicornis minor]|uniref:Uncharacterized protein n=1 Tax=Diceros bicornis minor TaxID=77932 RepID=A0A7J7EDU2_DICBM|nr:hypothetical protein HPG69_011996 [Diceros bicornis minor]
MRGQPSGTGCTLPHATNSSLPHSNTRRPKEPRGTQAFYRAALSLECAEMAPPSSSSGVSHPESVPARNRHTLHKPSFPGPVVLSLVTRLPFLGLTGSTPNLVSGGVRFRKGVACLNCHAEDGSLSPSLGPETSPAGMPSAASSLFQTAGSAALGASGNGFLRAMLTNLSMDWPMQAHRPVLHPWFPLKGPIPMRHWWTLSLTTILPKGPPLSPLAMSPPPQIQNIPQRKLGP